MKAALHTAPPAGAFWAPLGQPAFLVIWGASLLGNTAAAMRELAAAWLMTSLSPSALAIGMVKAAAALPVLLLALPGGALADRFDRRRMSIAIHALLALLTCGVGVLVARDAMSPALLVGAVFATGMASALLQPTQQSLLPLLVPRHQLESAIALNGMGLNLSRAVGPALAGLLVAGCGMAAAFHANAAGYLLVIAAFAWWKAPAVRAPAADREPMRSAMLAGLRFVRATPAFRRVLMRLGVFVGIASAYWTLLPGLIRHALAGTPGDYGNLLAAIGAGTVVMAVNLPWLRGRWSAEGTFQVALGATAAALAALAIVPDIQCAIPAALLAGAAWLAGLTVVNATAQALLPDAMRGRGMALYLMAFAGAMSLGGLFWGWLADALTLRCALGAAAAAGVLFQVRDRALARRTTGAA